MASEGVTPRKFAGGGHDHGHDHDHDHGKGDADGDKGGHHHHHGDADPHAWQNLVNGARYARNVAEGLAAADPAHADAYRQRALAYGARIEKLDVAIRQTFAAIPAERRKVVTSHDAFGYFGDAYGVTFIAVAGVSTAAEPSAADVARIIEQVKRERVPAVFVENITSPDWCSRSRAKPARRWVVRSIPMPCPSLDSPAPPTWKCLNGTHANSPRPCSPERRRRPAGGFDRQRASPHVDRRARGDRSGRGQAHHRRAAGLAIRRDVRRLCHAGPEEGKDGSLAADTRAGMARDWMKALGEPISHYFTRVSVDGKSAAFAAPRDARVDWDAKAGRLSLAFTLPLAEPMALGADGAQIDIYDPTYFVAYAFDERTLSRWAGRRPRPASGPTASPRNWIGRPCSSWPRFRPTRTRCRKNCSPSPRA